jgi:hypothetical protein
MLDEVRRKIEPLDLVAGFGVDPLVRRPNPSMTAGTGRLLHSVIVARAFQHGGRGRGGKPKHGNQLPNSICPAFMARRTIW